MEIKVSIKNNENVDYAIYTLNRFEKINNFKKIPLNIILNYELMDDEFDGYYLCGFFYQNSKKNKWAVFINPSECNDIPNFGYVSDFSIYGTIIHEFCHLLQFTIFKEKIIGYYINKFEDKLVFNPESGDERFEELADIMALYITNPYLLKHIDSERYNFCKKYFKSPIPCTESTFKKLWSGWTDTIQNRCKKKWKIWVQRGKIKKI